MYNRIHNKWNKFIYYFKKICTYSKKYLNLKYNCTSISNIGTILIGNKICHLLICEHIDIPNYLWSEKYNCSFSFKYFPEQYNFEYGIVFNSTAWNNTCREFILRHEIGHILLGHVDKPTNYNFTKEERTQQDFEADKYAMDTLQLSIEETIDILNCIVPKMVQNFPTNLNARIEQLREYKKY